MPDAFARLLRRMIEEGQLPRSKLSARSWKDLTPLFDAGVLSQARSGCGLVIEVRAPEALGAFFRKRYPSDGTAIDGPPRARAVGMLRNAKRAGRTRMEPVLIRAMDGVMCTRDNVRCDLRAATLQTGAACVVLESGRFWSMATDVAVVENLECFLHFEEMRVPAGVALYASGRLSDLVLQWFASQELSQCRFVHCGDYDPVGLDEYLRLKAIVGDRARLHIPSDIRNLVATFGRPELLSDSPAVLSRLRRVAYPEVRTVVEALDETGCGLEQEVLLLG